MDVSMLDTALALMGTTVKALRAEVERALLERTAQGWEDILNEAAVPATRVRKVPEILDHAPRGIRLGNEVHGHRANHCAQAGRSRRAAPEFAGAPDDMVRVLSSPDVLHIVVCGDPHRNRVMVMEGGHTQPTTKPIPLPAKWDELLARS